VCYSYSMQALTVAVLLAIMQTSPPVPRHTPNEAGSSSQRVKKHAGGNNTPSQSPPVQKPREASTEQTRTDPPGGPNAQKPIAITKLPSVSVEKDWMDKSTWGFGAIFLLVGALGVCAAVKTLRAIKRQTDLQETGMRQWIDLQKWDIAKAPLRPEDTLLIGFHIANPTHAPLELTLVMNTVSGTQINKESNIGFLPPGNPYIASLPVRLSKEQRAALDNQQLVLSLRCEVFFTDALKVAWHQIFGRMLFCEPGQITAIDTENRLQRDEQQQK
jgi:hypothetical protein